VSIVYLKQHRKAELRLDGRKLIGNFSVSLTNQGDRAELMEFIKEMKKQLMVFDPDKDKPKARRKKKAKRKAKRR